MSDGLIAVFKRSNGTSLWYYDNYENVVDYFMVINVKSTVV